MMSIKGFFKSFLLSMALLTAGASASGYDDLAQNGFRYGPNLSASFTGNTPFVWGQWLPQAIGEVHYTWLEPMGQLMYGDKLGREASYWRLDAAVELTPFTGGYKLGLGLRPVESRWQFEVNAIYESYLYFRSNVQMVTAEKEGSSGEIARTWNADHITDNVWSDTAEWDYSQLMDFCLHFGYMFEKGSNIGLNMHYILTDVSTDFDGKSYDYQLNMPVFSRDFLIIAELFGRIPFTEHFAAVFETDYYRTGNLRNEKSVQKESLCYGKALIGPHFSWNDGLQNLTLKLGGWRRISNTFYNGSLSQQFLVQLEYQGYFTFPSHGDLSE